MAVIIYRNYNLHSVRCWTTISATHYM